MLDSLIHQATRPFLERMATRLVRQGINANTVTLIGFGIGLSVVPALALNNYYFAIVAILLNRFADGLDGPMARQETGQSDGSSFGAILDIVCDFIFYAAVPFGFALSDPNLAPWAALLLFAFAGTGSSFLAFAIMAAKHNFPLIDPTAVHRGPKGFYYLGGLTEASETIVVFLACCLWPEYFSWFAGGFALACFITTANRVYTAFIRLP
ncbi:MAG: CDP-alcohol phosphatidyltransferase family protein [Alphaproteobacteria bacterium]